MATLEIRKKSLKTWLHIPSDGSNFILSKFYCKTDANTFKIVEESGSNRREYSYTNITVYDDTDIGTPETFASSQALMLRLEVLKYTGFNRDGDIPTSYIESVVAGTNVTVDNTDPLNPIISSTGGGGSSISYYLNGGTAASVATYYQMSEIAVVGTGVDFTKAGNGLISQWITDVSDPNRLEIPAGNWNFEMYMNASSSGGTPAFYVELLKYNGTTFTTISNSSAVPEAITGGTLIDLYLTSLAIPQTTLLVTDRLAIRVYIVNSTGGRTITMHTQDSHLCQIITNFAGGVTSLNGLTANTQNLAVGTSGSDFNISSVTDTHTFNLPTASATKRGALSSADWSTFNEKQGTLTLTTTGTSGAATLVGDTLNIPQYSGGAAAKEFFRMFSPMWGFAGTAVNTWFSWTRNTSTMISGNPSSLGATTSTPAFGDQNFILVNNKTKLNKVSWSIRDGALSQTIQIYLRSFTFANGTTRGSETNTQVLIDQSFTLPGGSSNGFKNDFTIATHTLDAITGIQIAVRITSGTPSSLQGVNLILEFE